MNPSPKQKKEGKACPYPNMQQLPSDEVTRACFTAMKGNNWCSCDFSAIELANLYIHYKYFILKLIF